MRPALLPALTAVSLSVATFAPGLDAQSVAPGFATSPLPDPAGSIHALSSGELLAYDGASLERYAADGTPLGTVFSLPGSFFAGCFAVSADESTALLGESTTGDVYVVDLATGTGGSVANLPFNFDAAFETANTAVVSAATCGFGCGNDLVRLDVNTGVTTLLASVAGASGPVEFGANGALYYGTSSAQFPPPPGATELLEFEAAALTGAPVLTEADARVVASGLAGAGDLEIDLQLGRLLLTENDFGTGFNRIAAIGIADGAVETLYEGATFDSLSDLQLVAPASPVPFLPWQPEAGGRLEFDRTDFVSVFERRSLAPRRPSLALSGPGVGGAGPVDLVLEDAPAFGVVALAACPFGSFAPSELTYPVNGLPLVHLGLAPATTVILSTALTADGSGTASFSFANSGGLVDVFAVQGIVADPGLSIVGSTSPAFL